MKRRSFCVLMVLLLCMNFGVPALATENNENTFSVSLSPNILDESTSNQRAFAQQEPLEMEIALSSYEYEHNSVVNSTVQISWNGNEKWDTTLTGEAYVYNEGDNPVIVGAVRGYNNSQEVSDFIGLDYTYDAVVQKCITTVTYSYWLCFLCCILGKITGIICIVILPDIVKMEEQKAASFRYRDKEIEKLKAECEAQKRRISQLEGKQEIDK